MDPRRWIAHLERLERLCREHPLRYLFLEVTRRCNLRCAYCGSSCTAQESRAELDGATWISIIDQVADDFDAKGIMIAVTGGEPLVRGDIFEIFEALRRRGFRFGMVSNGTHIDGETARRLVASGIGSISLSLDGPPAINDALRGAGSAAAIEGAVRALRGAGYEGILEIISTITKPVLPALDELRKIVSRLRVPRWRVAPVMPIGRAAGRPELLLDGADVRALFDFVLSARRDALLPAPEMSEEGYLGDAYEGAVRPYLCRCGAGVTVGGVLHDGHIGACPELPRAFNQGHVARDRFKDVWERGYGVFRDRSWAVRRAPCATCDALDRCRGGAMHLYASPTSEPLRCFYRMLGG